MKPSVLILPVLLEGALAFDVCKSGCRQGSVKGKLEGHSERGGAGCEAFCSH